MTTKPNKPSRLEWEVKTEEKARYVKRKQEEREAENSLRDFLRHLREEEDDHTPPD